MKIRKVARSGKRVNEAFIRLLPQLTSDSIDTSQQRLKEILKSGSTILFVAEKADKSIAGMLSLVIYDIPTGRKAIIEDVVVDESERGAGFGKALMLHAIDYARESGASAIDLTSRPSRMAANALYQALGFSQRETNCYRYHLKKKY